MLRKASSTAYSTPKHHEKEAEIVAEAGNKGAVQLYGWSWYQISILAEIRFEAGREMKKLSIPLSRLHSQQVLKSLTTKN